MTLTTIRTEARTLLRDVNGMIFSDTFLNSAINMGVLTTEMISGAYEPTSASITLVANVAEYVNPFNTAGVDNCLKIYSAYYLTDTTNIDDAKGLGRIHPIVYGQEKGVMTGEPNFYYDFAGMIGVYPAPSATEVSNGGKLYIKACKIGEYDPTTTGSFDADILNYLPTEFHRAIVYYAVMSAFIKDGKHAQAGLYYNKYISEVTAWRRMIVERPEDSLDKLRFPDRVIMANQEQQVQG